MSVHNTHFPRSWMASSKRFSFMAFCTSFVYKQIRNVTYEDSSLLLIGENFVLRLEIPSINNYHLTGNIGITNQLRFLIYKQRHVFSNLFIIIIRLCCASTTSPCEIRIRTSALTEPCDLNYSQLYCFSVLLMNRINRYFNNQLI